MLENSFNICKHPFGFTTDVEETEIQSSGKMGWWGKRGLRYISNFIYLNINF